MIAANAGVGKPWGHQITGVLCGLLAGATFLFGAIDIAAAGLDPTNPIPGLAAHPVDAGIMVTALLAALLTAKPLRDRVARVLPMDPEHPVHAVALVLGVILLGTQVSAIAFSDVLGTDLKLPPLSLADLFWQELPFVILAAVGVGLYLRRQLPQSIERLGIVRPRFWQIALALAAAGGFYALGYVSESLSQSLTPQLADRVAQTSNHLFSALDNPVGIVALALIPGICEEVLFRGALQPRFGLIATAVLFTAIHTEYGVSIDVATIFVLALGLGLIRKYANTTACCACHVAYNLITGTGLPGPLAYVAIGVEVVLIAVVIYAFATRARKSEEPISAGLG